MTDAQLMAICQAAQLREAAHTLVPPSPVEDVGFLLGIPANSHLDGLKALGLRKDERDSIARAATTAALQATHALIWRPRCDEVAERLGTWRERIRDAHASPPRQHQRPRTSEAPRTGWQKANSLLLTDTYQPLVELLWRP